MPAADLLPWLAIAGMGALHGLNPASGWMLAAAWSWRTGDGRQPLRSLWAIGVGHAASVASTALLVAAGLRLDRSMLQLLAGVLLAVSIGLHAWRRSPCAARRPAGQAGLALGAFIGSSLHGTGLMLVPALMPFCVTDAAAGPSEGLGPLGMALAAAAVHGAAMLAVTGLIAAGICSSFGAAGSGFRNSVRKKLFAICVRGACK